ncbi:hypothetical protein HF324_29795 [Chitinophaga oryzae]|uniref:Uncharacterized protein n=1 Tax=Chitinophaga oryzae TaxID=2725414 RepID=A0AAE6ZLL7_9BACT|nr:hypothetical protein [Chitinophaga oryzae]QJB35276.1 hypothetical protein HF329_29820 [Chitinophaga oryzae]QJB41811.1 hypothetical protein HF324_29795 [Chitinophaga oryzae]
MIKKILFLLAIVHLMYACNNNGKPSGADSTQAAADTTAPETAVSVTPAYIDTLEAGDKKFLVYFIDKATYEQYPAYEPSGDTSETNALSKVTNVKRNGPQLVFNLANGGQKIRTDNPEDDGEDYARYRYAGYYPELQRHGLFITYYEADGFELLNPDNGDTLYTWTAPVPSPDKKYFICPSMDIEAGFNPNGFQLFEINNKNIKLVGEAGIEKYGLSDMQWIDNKTLIAIYQTHDDIASDRHRYVKLVMQ